MRGANGLIGLVTLAMPVLLVIALMMLAGVRRRIEVLERLIADLRAQIGGMSAPVQAPPSASTVEASGSVGPTGTPSRAAGTQAAAAPAEAGARAPAVAPAEIPRPVHVSPAAPVQVPVSVPATLEVASASTIGPDPDPDTKPEPVAAPAASTPMAPPPLPPLPPHAQISQPPAGAPSGATGHAARPAPREPGVFTRGLRLVRQWFTTGNLPVKIGILVLFAGVAALLKYASDQGVIDVPVPLRLAAVAAAATGGLVFGWLRRESHRSFALSLQGGMIGILLLVVFAAAKMFGLVTPVFAFVASLLLVAGAGVLAVLQRSMALAVFAVLAGFLAPIWLSTGSGNHVALFSYYAVLNAAIVAIAWFRAWRLLNLLGFVFTFGIGTVWGVLDYEAVDYLSAQCFLALFFAMYLAVPLLYARQRPAGRRGFIDGCLVFGTPLIAFTLQAGLLRDSALTLALCALGLAVVYAALAWALRRGGRFRMLQDAYLLLAVGFATLAGPLGLSARMTACVYAIEGAALVWLGLRQNRALARWAGIALQGVAMVAYGFAGVQVLPGALPFAHPAFLGALLIALSGLAIAWSYARAQALVMARIGCLWALLWWLGAWVSELVRVLPDSVHPEAVLLLTVATGWLLAERHRRVPDPLPPLLISAGFVVAGLVALWQTVEHQQPFAGYGLWAWMVFAGLGARSLVCLRAGAGTLASVAQFMWWLLWPSVLSLVLLRLAVQAEVGAGWSMAALVLPWWSIGVIALVRARWLGWPLGQAFEPAQEVFRTVCCTLVGLWWLHALGGTGDSAPLPWVVVLNPLDLAQIAALAMFARWMQGVSGESALRARAPLLATLGFVLITVITLRAAHHWGGAGWGWTLTDSAVAQGAVSIVWSALGVLGWVSGSRRGQRGLWLAGAVLMAVVLVKLVFVDRSHLGNLWGIASFIAYGLLCTVVGFIAPAPPRAPAASAAAEADT